MSDFNNTYKRFQAYQPSELQTNLKKDYMEQNYNINSNKKELGEKKELTNPKELKQLDKDIMDKSVKLGVNNFGKFYKR